MSAPPDLLTATLRQPARVAEWSLPEWDRLLRQARRSALSARIYAIAEIQNLLDSIPEPVRWHLMAAHAEAQCRADAVRWEVGRIEAALREAAIPIVLLKGAAYVMANLPAANGRIFGDVDILVPRAALQQTENLLNLYGWQSASTDAYDQRYYREWTHELPPLQHSSRQTVLDVHHTILPPTTKAKPDPAKLLASAVRIDADAEIYTLGDLDMVLHSATHLFYDGEFNHGLRDLVDLDLLLRHFESRDGFMQQLAERAVEMELTLPLFYALRYLSVKLGRASDPDLMQRLGQHRRPGLQLRFMDSIFVRGLAPDHPSCADALSGLARWSLYVRSHYLRMPPHLLLPHLLRKAFKPLHSKP